MKIELPIKLHNKFEVEVRDVTTGEIVTKGYAENIILDNFFNLATLGNHITALHFGRGTGVIAASRTTLFNQIGSRSKGHVESVFNQVPVPSYSTHKIVINPDEFIGETFTEVGWGNGSTTIYTHALLKDSEGNPLTLGPKTDTQEITIYATNYFTPNFEDGITLIDITGPTSSNRSNAFLMYFTFRGAGDFFSLYDLGGSTTKTRLKANGVTDGGYISRNNSPVNGSFNTNLIKFLTSQANGKIKTLKLEPVSSSSSYGGSSVIELNLETLAENNSTTWSGHEFDNTPIGTGDGSQTVFNLTWDEAWLTKPYKVYVDGIEITSGVTFNTGNITFDTAPADQAVITADYWVKYVPKDSNHELWIDFIINYAEGSPV